MSNEKMSQAEVVARMALVAKDDPATYQLLLELMFAFVVENHSRSDFPTKCS